MCGREIILISPSSFRLIGMPLNKYSVRKIECLFYRCRQISGFKKILDDRDSFVCCSKTHISDSFMRQCAILIISSAQQYINRLVSHSFFVRLLPRIISRCYSAPCNFSSPFRFYVRATLACRIRLGLFCDIL